MHAKAIFIGAIMLTACAPHESKPIVDAGSGLTARPNAPTCNADTFVNPPQVWSQSGCANASNLLFYEVNVPSWFDGLTATRYLSIPAGKTIAVNADHSLTYPNGTVVIQHLSQGNQLVETRVLSFASTWAALSYAWYERDAALVTTDGATETVNDIDYKFFARADCLQCHNAAAGYTLGSKIAQLDRNVVYDATRNANQLDTWAAIALINGDTLPSPRPQFSDPLSGASFTERARSYLDANCANCHQPGSANATDMDLRYTTAFAATNLCEFSATPIDGLAHLQRVAPGAPTQSALSLRLRTDSMLRQPPVGILRNDVVGAALIDQWIETEVPQTACQ